MFKKLYDLTIGKLFKKVEKSFDDNLWITPQEINFFDYVFQIQKFRKGINVSIFKNKNITQNSFRYIYCYTVNNPYREPGFLIQVLDGVNTQSKFFPTFFESEKDFEKLLLNIEKLNKLKAFI